MAYKGPQEVTGPASSVDETIPRFNGTGGDLVQTSGVSITDADICNGITQLNVDNLRLDGNTLSSTDTNGNVVLAPDGTGVVSVTSAPIVPSGDRADSLGSTTNSWDNVYCDGVSFDDGTNVLSTYTTGSWTPVLSFGGGSTGITYTTQIGAYYRIGSIVYYLYAVQLSSKGTSTGNALISGLPFTVTGSFNMSTAIGGWGSLTLTANYTVAQFRPIGGTTTADLVQSGTNVSFATITDTNYQNTTLITGTGFYFI